MRPFSSICILAFALSLSAQTATQSAPRKNTQKKKITPSTARKSTTPAKAGTPAAKSAVSAGSGHTASRTTSTKSGTRTTRRVAARPRKSTPPRQQTPTAERYVEIQQALTTKGYFTGPVNGVWGADSIAALKRFQADQNLQADGKIGSLSLIALGLGPKHESVGEVAAQAQE